MNDEPDRDDPHRDEPAMDDEQLTAREQARLRQVADLLADPGMWMAPTDELEGTVLAAIRREPRSADRPAPAQRGGAVPPPPTPPRPPPPPPAPNRPPTPPGPEPMVPPPPSAQVIGLERAPSARRRRWVTAAAAAVASAAAAVLITTAVVHRDQGEQQTAVGAGAPSTVVATKPSEDQSPDGSSTSAFPDADPPAPGANPTSGSASRETFTLGGTQLAPGVSGTGEVGVTESGTRLAIRMTGLADRRGGDFYQVWLSDCAKTVLVPAGSFHNLDDAVAWAGVSPDDFPRVTVTAESAAAGDDIGQESSGEVYATGMIGTCPD